MKRRSDRIRKVVSLAEADEKRLGQALGKTRQSLDAQLGKLGELNAYRQTYLDKSRGCSRMSLVHWKDYQAFLGKLDNAVQAQQQLIRAGEQALDAHKQRWLVSKQHLESLQRMLGHYETGERIEEDRRAQKLLDDMAGPAKRFEDD